MNVQTRLSLQTIAILALGIVASVAASYTAQLITSDFSAAGWLSSSLTDGLPVVHASLTETLSAEARDLSRSSDLRQGVDPAAVSSTLRGEFTSAERFWAVVDADRTVGPVSRPGCARAAQALVGGTEPRVLACDGAAMLALYAPVAGARWGGLVLGTFLDERYADQLARLFNTEAVVYGDGAVVASSFRDVAGRRIRPPAPMATAGSAVSFGQHPLTLRGYHGFTMGHRVVDPGEGARWYFSGRRLDGAVVVAFLVPVVFMTQGARYGAAITGAFALVLIAAMALLVWRMVRQFTRPVLALSASSRAVAGGDLTIKVPVPADAEIGGLCRNYNHMLDSMQEMLATQKTLARATGMSEVATGVLHNVGNVLNSVNVSAALSLECADRLKLASLDRAVATFEGAGDGLGRFLTEDARGRKMPQFLRALVDQLSAERQRLRDELRLLMERVESIKAIVATQQQFAGAGALVERCSLASLIDSAVRFEATALQRHEVELVREVPDDLALVVDRHKVIHILVNLLSNARQAMSAMSSPRRVILRAADAGDGTLRLSVEDNGVGIAAADLSKIFAYGYTTRRDGHGFGLHQSALSATQMGGALAVASDGLNRGAVFTVTLPVAGQQSQTAR